MGTRSELGRKTKRWIAAIVVSALIIEILLLLYVQIDARIVRARAERLQAEMRSLIVGKSTMRDLQALSARWGKSGSYEDGCSETKCVYDIELVQHGPRELWLARILANAGRSHLARIALSVRVEAGLVTKADYSLWTFVPPGDGPRWEAERFKGTAIVGYSTSDSGYFLVARAVQTEPLDLRMCCHKPAHADYLLAAPSGCEGCLAIWTEFTPHTSMRDRYRMTDFNFSCITRWTPCKDEEDIMPDAGKEYEGEVIEELKEEREQPSRG